jgi:hypothetical protein
MKIKQFMWNTRHPRPEPNALGTASAMAIARENVHTNNFVLTFLKPRNIKA